MGVGVSDPVFVTIVLIEELVDSLDLLRALPNVDRVDSRIVGSLEFRADK